jgi:hypothetical protein
MSRGCFAYYLAVYDNDVAPVAMKLTTRSVVVGASNIEPSLVRPCRAAAVWHGCGTQSAAKKSKQLV